MHAPLLSSPTESDPPHRRHRHGRVGMPAYHLAKTVGIYGGTTPRGGLHHAAGYRRPMVPTLCSAERVSRRLRPLIESGAVGPAAGFVRTQVETDASSSSCSPTSTRGAGATESCTTNAARCSPQQFAHAPPPLSPRFRFAWTKHLPTHFEEWGPSRRGFGTVQQTRFDDVTQMVKISDRRFAAAVPQDAIHGC